MDSSAIPPIGAHLSAAGGVWRAVERAVELDCTALQLFTQAPGRWRAPALTEGVVARFCKAAAAAGLVGRCFAHAPYLLNPASGDAALRQRCVAALADQLNRAHALALAGVVLHPGAHGGAGAAEGIRRAVAGARAALEASTPGPRLLLEVTAGAGTTMGGSFGELAAMLAELPDERVGVCWDTAHLWAAGVDLVSTEGWEDVWDSFRAETGRAAPDLVHLNDTEMALGSNRDRHAQIGHGLLGYRTFARMVRDPRLACTPMVIETPKSDDEVTWDQEALDFLRAAACAEVERSDGRATQGKGRREAGR